MKSVIRGMSSWSHAVAIGSIALILSACSDYVDKYEGNYKETIGNEEVFRENLDKVNVDLTKVCSSGKWAWCATADDGTYNTANNGVFEVFTEGGARITFMGKNDKAYDYSIDRLDSNLMPFLRRNGGIGFYSSLVGDGETVGISFKMDNLLSTLSNNNIVVAYTNGCHNTYLTLTLTDDAGNVAGVYRKLIDESSTAVAMKFDPDSMTRVSGEDTWLDAVAVGATSAKASIVMTESCPEGKSFVLVGVGYTSTTRNSSGEEQPGDSSGSTDPDSNGSTNPGSNGVESSANEGNSSSGTVQNSSSSTPVASSSSTARSSSSVAQSSSSVIGFLWNGSESSIVKSTIGFSSWYFRTDEVLGGNTVLYTPDNMFENCHGVCGLVDFGNYTPAWAETYFNVSDDTRVFNVTNEWGDGICFTYKASEDAEVRLLPRDESVYNDNLPSAVLEHIASYEVARTVSLKWDAFKQKSSSGPQITGPEIAQILKGISVRFNGNENDSNQFFIIYEVGSSDRCGFAYIDFPKYNQEIVKQLYENSKKYDSFVDSRDGRTYKTVKIGDQTWMAENLDYYTNSSVVSDYTTYGRLYTWEEAQTVCPAGWHLPSEEEYSALFNDAGGMYIAASHLKSITGWSTEGTPYTGYDTYGFTALPAGFCYTPEAGGEGCHEQGTMAAFWNSTVQDGSGLASYVILNYNSAEPVMQTQAKDLYLSVRCIKDLPPKASDYLKPDFEYGEYTDPRDGQVYKTTMLDGKRWFAQNLNYADSVATSVLKGNSWCYGNSQDSCTKYGRLYTRAAALEVCPSGWHLPTTEEYRRVNNIFWGKYVSTNYQGPSVKYKSTMGWTYDGTDYNGTDDFGFTALPGGYREKSGDDFYEAGYSGYFWTSSPAWSGLYSVYRVRYDNDQADFYRRSEGELRGYSVRCAEGDAKTSVEDYLKPDFGYGTYTDGRDGQVYKTIEIDGNTWMAQNLNYADSTSMPALEGNTSCLNEFDENCTVFGRLYTWNAAMQVCPQGWHLPSDDEFNALKTFVGADSSAFKLRTTDGWVLNGSDAIGFSALPAVVDGDRADFWSTFSYSESAYYFSIIGELAEANLSSGNMTDMRSVRCVREKDVETTISESDLIWYGSRAFDGLDAFIKTDLLGTYVVVNNNARNYFDFGAEVDETNEIRNNVLLACGGGICGSVKSAAGYPEFGFNVNSAAHMEEWGGLCLTYSSDNAGIWLKIAPKDDAEYNDFTDWGTCRVELPKQETMATRCYAWSEFVCSSPKIKLDAYLPRAAGLNFVFPSGLDGASFNIAAVGKYSGGMTAYNTYMQDKEHRTSAWIYLNPSVEYDTIIDARDGEIYKILNIGEQTWMAENLNYKPKGDTASYCYDNDSTNCKLYGRLYPWKTALNVCPDGWHLPSYGEYAEMLLAIGDETMTGVHLKSTYGGWQGGAGDNNTGFTALPAGVYMGDEGYYMGERAEFWSTKSSVNNNNHAWNLYLSNEYNVAYQNEGNLKTTGRSVRCIKGVKPVCSGKTLKTDDTLTVDGRRVVVKFPSGFTGEEPAPMLVTYHPMGTDPKNWISMASIIDVALANGAIVVIPEGKAKASGTTMQGLFGWNVGVTEYSNVDDIQFTRDFISAVSSEACVDSWRIYAHGFSHGAIFVNYAGCELADLFAAGAASSGDLLSNNNSSCGQVRPFPIINTRGTNDAVIKYAGGDSGYNDGMTFMGAEGTFTKWAQVNNCTGTPVSDEPATGCQTYENCGGGTRVTLCTVTGGSHDQGNPNTEWNFLSQFTLP